MTKLVYLAAMATLGLGLTVAQNTSTPSDSSNSSKSSQSGNAAGTVSPNTSAPDQTSPATKGTRHQHGNVPDTTVRDQQSSTTSTTGVSGQSDSRPSGSNMGTSGSKDNPAPADNGTSPQNGSSTDHQPNSSSSPTAPNARLVLNDNPGARAAATHTPDPGTCMAPAAQSSEYPNHPVAPNCD